MGLTRRDVVHTHRKDADTASDANNLGPSPVSVDDLIYLEDYVDLYDVELVSAEEHEETVGQPLEGGLLDYAADQPVRVLSVTPRDGQYRVLVATPLGSQRLEFYVSPE